MTCWSVHNKGIAGCLGVNVLSKCPVEPLSMCIFDVFIPIFNKIVFFP